MPGSNKTQTRKYGQIKSKTLIAADWAEIHSAVVWPIMFITRQSLLRCTARLLGVIITISCHTGGQNDGGVFYEENYSDGDGDVS